MLPQGGYYTELYNLDSEFQSDDSNSSFSRSLSGNTYRNYSAKSATESAPAALTPGRQAGRLSTSNDYYSCTVITPMIMPQPHESYTRDHFFTADLFPSVKNPTSAAADLLCGGISVEDTIAAYPNETRVEERCWKARKKYRIMKFVAGFLQVLSLIVQWSSLVRDLVISPNQRVDLVGDRIEDGLFGISMSLLIACKAFELVEGVERKGWRSMMQQLGISLDSWIIVATSIFLLTKTFQRLKIDENGRQKPPSLVISAETTLLKTALSCSYLINSFFHGEDDRLVEAAVEATLRKLRQKKSFDRPNRSHNNEIISDSNRL